MLDFHFLRPFWLLSLIPWLLISLYLLRQTSTLQAWNEVCDAHLLKHLLGRQTGKNPYRFLLFCLAASLFFLIISLSGPSWSQVPVPAYQPAEPTVVVLDLSDDMSKTDIQPSRLARAKFKLQDLFERSDIGQWAMVVYTGEPFVVSPLTEDGQTIAALLPMLTNDIMPVSGNRLDDALTEAEKLITQAGFQKGRILVLTGTEPSKDAIRRAGELATEGIRSSILILGGDKSAPGFKQFAQKGGGKELLLSADASDLDQWLDETQLKKEFVLSQHHNLPLWRDEGRWFLIPALLFLLPLFRRGWLERVME